MANLRSVRSEATVKKNKPDCRLFESLVNPAVIFLSCILLSGALLLATACSNRPDIPVRDGYFFDNTHIKEYKVRPGDTLYSIAWHLNRDYKKIAVINGIAVPYEIFPGQVLRLDKNQQKLTAAKVSQGNDLQKAGTATLGKVENQNKTNSSGAQVKSNKKIRWSWPADGQVLSRFSTRGVGNKGLDIGGKPGDAVRSAANGYVVYRGDALLGYGKIIIIKHNDQFLSAYAHNSQLLVNEGQWIKAGQQIAKIGSSGTNRNKLHFEIRREGIPVDPLRYLPTR